MGVPPKYVVHRKLLKKFLNTEVIPAKPLIPPYYFTKVFQCWKRFGPGSFKCKQDQIMYDFANQQVQNYKKTITGMNLKQTVSSQLKKPIYPVFQKGRFKKDPYTTILKYL